MQIGRIERSEHDARVPLLQHQSGFALRLAGEHDPNSIPVAVLADEVLDDLDELGVVILRDVFVVHVDNVAAAALLDPFLESSTAIQDPTVWSDPERA